MKKTPLNEQIQNDNNSLVSDEPQTDDIVPAEPLSREDRFIIELYQNGGSMREAGIAAGYSPSYASSIICRKFRSERFLKKLRDYNYSEYHKLLPKISRIDQKALAHVDEDISRLPRFERTLSTIKRQIGILDDHPRGPANIIAICEIQNLLQNVHVHEEDASD